MERPTCKTCPYFDLEESTKEDKDVGEGWCQRHAPRPTFREASEFMWPWTRETKFCGEHPDFPAYIASLKPLDVNDNSSIREQLAAKLKSLSDEDIYQMLKILMPREREVIRLSFGLTPHVSSYHCDEIARIFKITRERARQIENKAIKILMASFAKGD